MASFSIRRRVVKESPALARIKPIHIDSKASTVPHIKILTPALWKVSNWSVWCVLRFQLAKKRTLSHCYTHKMFVEPQNFQVEELGSNTTCDAMEFYEIYFIRSIYIVLELKFSVFYSVLRWMLKRRAECRWCSPVSTFL